MDVVEIDPGVTEVAHEHLGLKPDHGHRRRSTWTAGSSSPSGPPPGSYDLIIQDAVNDLSVPAHLLTKEYNDAVKAALKPDGVYLLTIIDALEDGKLWRAAVHTLRQTYPADNVAMLTPRPVEATDGPARLRDLRLRTAARPGRALREEVWKQLGRRGAAIDLRDGAVAGFAGLQRAGAARRDGEMSGQTAAGRIARFLHPPGAAGGGCSRTSTSGADLLTDQFAPTDNLMADVFRYRTRKGG